MKNDKDAVQCDLTRIGVALWLAGGLGLGTDFRRAFGSRQTLRGDLSTAQASISALIVAAALYIEAFNPTSTSRRTSRRHDLTKSIARPIATASREKQDTE
uniref:Uncharacterized protein n=1 Tax=Mycena chlorophos TaxID=658473 RepID=A0ABQ0LD78_MYCCL|nr:predicted protein [Mycena chlorophos]